MSEYRTGKLEGCQMTAAQLSELAHAKISDPTHGELAAIKLRSLRGLPDFQVVVISVTEAQALGATVGIDVFSTGDVANPRRHIIRSMMVVPKTVKAGELKGIAAQSKSGVADALLDHLQGLSPDADVTIEAELWDTLASTAMKRSKRDRDKKVA